jgi:ABC-type molybdate transport system substrate-binding protein
LTVIAGAAKPAQDFARFIVSPAAQRIIAGHGFAPGQS